MSDTLDARVARIEEAILSLKDDRLEARENRKEVIAEVKDLRAAIEGLSQNVRSTGEAVSRLSLEKCGERLDDHDGRIKALETKTVNLPTIETEIMFWRRVLGGGFHALWKMGLALVGAGGFGAWLSSHFHWGN